MATFFKNGSKDDINIGFKIEINTGDSTLSKKDKLEFSDLEKNMLKWCSDDKTKGICFKCDRIEPLENNT